eukprot:c1755_g1_i1 orf=218-457(+)
MDSTRSHSKTVSSRADPHHQAAHHSYSAADSAPFEQDGNAFGCMGEEYANAYGGGTDERQVLLAITVEIEEGRMEEIAV